MFRASSRRLLRFGGLLLVTTVLLAETGAAWGDTITHTQANYYSSATHVYDISATRNYHPDFNTNGFPYTNPTDVFAPNAFGLFGMADNVCEWCWDWFDAAWYNKPPRRTITATARAATV